MSYILKMQEAIKEIENFDKEIEKKVNDLIETVNTLDFSNMVNEDEQRQVAAHKNRVLKVINREIDKFARGIDTYILPLIKKEEESK